MSGAESSTGTTEAETPVETETADVELLGNNPFGTEVDPEEFFREEIVA